MPIINSTATPGRTLSITPVPNSDDVFLEIREDGVCGAFYANRAELLAALRAVRLDAFETQVRYKLQAIDRAEKAEATLAETHVTERREEPLADWERDLLGPQNDDGRYWHKRTEQADAKLAEAEATIERVRALAEKWRYKGEFGWGPWQAGEGPDPEGQFLDDAASELRAALTPPKPFELPTVAGVKFYAEDADGDSGIFTTLVGGTEPLYLYDDDQDYVYSGPELASWQNFRMIDGEAA